MEEKLVLIINEMADYLSVAQLKKLQEVLLKTLVEGEAQKQIISNDGYLKLFLDAKKIEGCSERTLDYYERTVRHLLNSIETPIRKMTTEEIRICKEKGISLDSVRMIEKKHVNHGIPAQGDIINDKP